MKTIGYAIVGTGYFGAELGRILNEQEGARVVAVLDPDNAPAIAQELHCDLETDLEGLCARPDVDAVIVATPNYLHKEPVLCAARHKKNIFCEKPIALSYADCDEMVRAAEENGVVFMAGHVMNFFRAVRRTKQFIAEGKIGRSSTVIPPGTAGRRSSPRLVGKRSGPSPAATSIIISTSWTVSNSSWVPPPRLRW